jgi:polar amino acid transport system substrate-binding protein
MAGPLSEQSVLKELAPTGVLRAGINIQNTLLVSGRDASGEPIGVAPSLARAVAERLNVPLRLVRFDSAKKLGDAVHDDVWDIGLMGAEPARAERIAFTVPYCAIEATYLVPATSRLRTVAEVDGSGLRIAVSAGSAYDLWLKRNIRHAELVHAENLAMSRNVFVDQRLDALAGLRAWLIEQAATLQGCRILDGRFTAVEQAIGTSRSNKAAIGFLSAFVEDAKRSGLVADLIAQHRAPGLSVAQSGDVN